MYKKSAIRDAQIVGRIYRILFGDKIPSAELEKAAAGAFHTVTETYKTLPSAKRTHELQRLVASLSTTNSTLIYELKDELAEEFLRGYRHSTCNNIRKKRTEARMNASDLAKALGVSKSRLSRIEDYGMPGALVLMKIATILSCRMDELVDPEGIDFQFD